MDGSGGSVVGSMDWSDSDTWSQWLCMVGSGRLSVCAMACQKKDDHRHVWMGELD